METSSFLHEPVNRRRDTFKRGALFAARLIIVGAGVAVLGVHPSLDAQVDAGRALHEAEMSGDYATAAEASHRLYEIQPWRVELLARAAEAEIRAGLYDEAERDFASLADLRPLTAHEIGWRGTIYAGRGEIDRAMAAWEEARAMGAFDPQALVPLAELYVERGEWSQASSVLAALAQIQPDDANLLVRLGIIQALDQPEAAAITLAQAAGLDPGLAERVAPLRASLGARAEQSPDHAYANLGVIYLSLEELRLAEAALERAAAYNPAYPDALAYLGYVRARLDEPSLGATQQAVALAPDQPPIRYLAGLAWMEHGRPAEARVHFERAYDLDPNNPAICVEIASTHRMDHNLEWAEIWMQEAVRLAPSDPRFRLLLVQFYVDEEYKIEETGLALAQELVETMPDSAEAHDALAWAYYLTDDLDAAQAELDQAMTHNPSLARAYMHMGAVMERRGNLSEAMWYYLETLKLEAEGPFAARAERAIERLGGG